MYKLDYLTRLFKSIGNKRFESYAVQRIWHLLNDDSILIVTQQYFKKTNGSYALADLYLPQLDLVIEINEGQHYTIDNKIRDAIRNHEIETISGATVIVINASNVTLNDFNREIDDVVKNIKRRIKNKGKSYIPWEGDMFSSTYLQTHKCLRVCDQIYVKSIDDVAAIFGTKAIHRGYLRAAGFPIPFTKNTMVWTPSIYSKQWANVMINASCIEEYNKIDPVKRTEHVKQQITKDEVRVTFFKQKDFMGLNYYKYVGVFRIDKVASLKINKCIWRRVDTVFCLPQAKNDMVFY